MKKIFDILKRKMFPSKKSDCIATRLGLALGILLCVTLLNVVFSTSALAQIGPGMAANANALALGNSEKRRVKNEIYKEEIKISANVQKILEKDRVDGWLNQAMISIQLTANNQVSTLEGLLVGNHRQYASSVGDSQVENQAENLEKAIERYVKKGKITAEEADMVRREAQRIIKEGAKKAAEFAKYWNNDELAAEISRSGELAALEMQETCPNMEVVRAKYNSGCWACLIIERLAASFMSAAEKGINVSERAGKILLGIGAFLWIVLWGLRTVSSMTQLEPANVLNELIKFCFKVMLAYAFIEGGMSMVSKYFVNPIMGIGAKIATAYWEEDQIKPYTEDFVWEDEIVTQEQETRMVNAIAQNNKARAEAADASEITTYTKGEEKIVTVPPQPITNSPNEGLIQNIQKAFITILQQQLAEIQGSCASGNCDKCRTSSCTDAGHQNYVASLHQKAGSGFNGNVAYCQAAITAAMNKLTDQIGGNLTTVLQDAKAGCALGLDIGVKNNAITAASNGENIYICDQGRLMVTPNVGDTIYIHKTINKNNQSKILGATSGYHAITYAGSGKYIGFNSDREGTLCGTYYTAIGRVVCVSCLLRQKLEANPQLASGINNRKLKKLANESPLGSQTLVNYTVGSYVGAGDVNGESLIVSFPDVEYNGPENLISKSVMNSILGATYAISNITSENMILGDGLMCYAKLKGGGAWDLKIFKITNVKMWLEGAFIWCTGLLLSVAFVFYLLDIAFKIGFAAMALPLAVGLWPFEITKDKVGVCVSIIAKAAATFAFIAMTTTFIVHIHDAAFNYETETSAEIKAADEADIRGLARLYATFDKARSEEATADDLKYVASKMEIFGTTFVLLLFAFLYSYKLLQQTVPSLVDKFFPDKGFGSSSPMHHMATAVVRKGKDIAMKPIGWARDAALYQGGRGINKGAGWIGGKITGKGKNKDDKSGSGIGSTMKETSRSIKENARNVKQTAKTAKDGARSVKEGAEAVESASNAADMAGTAMQATAATGVGAPVAAAGVGVSAAAKVTGTISSATKTTAGVAEKSFETVEKVAETVEKVAEVAEKVSEAVEKVEEVAENVKKGAEKAGKSSEKNDNKSGENSKGEK